jgi:outer membrane protein OmpA-like peptidoglycan-associated protein
VVADSHNESYPLAAYWQGICLRANGKYAEAEKVLSAFIKSHSHADGYVQSARKELLNLAFIREQLGKKDTISIKLAKLTGDMNAPGFANYAPATSGNTVYFTSTRRDTTRTDAPYYNNLYLFGKDSTAVHSAGIPTQAGMEQGVAALTPDGNTLYLTRWQKNEAGKNIANLYISYRSAGNNWSSPQADSILNIPGYSTQQPAVTADGRFLLFASDRPGGEGALDIWYLPLTGKQTPRNAGKQINTPGNEQSPFYHSGTATLVFATDNRTGMGGYDLYSSKGSFTSGTWAQPVNMGYPLNSVKDDMYFTTSHNDTLLQQAWLSSDRASVCCLELFAVTVPPAPALVTPAISTPVTTPPDTAAAPVPDVLVSVPSGHTPVKIYFDFDESTLLPFSYTGLDSLAAQLAKVPALIVEIAGYADAKGTEEYNISLSQRRAEACYQYLVQQKHISPERLLVKAYGECCPVEKELNEDGTDNAPGRKLNRRVEFKVSGIK